ncbi:hypothetical protein COU54_02165 [Candidatus Pacearchaeota archaeon CG10_big_fil_rev_8_21_14_0_10_31_24]|nr:MAG: hypothetical protein COU54_02165 [Candidatus Pacearchaeota archaeon CG10_big_fil_rev_8_21_14_0_10_31_24]
MAETKIIEKEYTIPLRRVWLNVPIYNRTKKSVKAIKIYVAKHMKVRDRDIDKVKLDVYFNNELWFRGRSNPPAKIKVKAIKEGEIVKVSFVETPQHVILSREKVLRRHRAGTSTSTKPKAEAHDHSHDRHDHSHPEEKSSEQKTDEKEKGKAGAEQSIKQADASAKAQKHITPVKEPKINRMALKK